MILQPNLYSESNFLIQIEQCVLQICTAQPSPDWIAEQLYQLIPAWRLHYQSHYIYSMPIQAFSKVIQMLNLPFQFQQDDINIGIVEYFSQQLKLLYSPSKDFEQRQYANNERQNRISLQQNLTELIQHYSRLLFVRVDLYFSAEAQVDLTIHRCHQYLQILLNRLSNRDGCFQDLQWWAWALEQGAQRGYHIHLLLIYDGHKHQQDEYLALQVGHYWKDDLTAGEGEFYTANQAAFKAQYQARGCLGIGMIHRDHPNEVANALAAAVYLANPEKQQQMLRAKLPNMRSFGTAQFRVSWRRGIRPINT
ncbi:YagK/YfjJ domain-containing protein [Acinetobacter soli]|uniref:YagK/YfjJ domain-containing protein n=1 Tax=Acinetobacter soli TaxID=487316 RepID=UPI00370A8616